MAEMNVSATFGDDQQGNGRPHGPVLVGVLLVAIGGAMLAERTNLLPAAWRLSIWPVLLMAFGVTRLIVPSRRGRRGLLFVLGGAWWFAGLQGWLSFERTWPLLIVFYGASVVVEGLTSQPTMPRDAFPRRQGGMSWVLTAILVGALISSGNGHDWSRVVDARGRTRIVALMGNTQYHVEDRSFRVGELVTVMGRSVIDLRDLPREAASEVTLDGVTAMGNTVIRVPRGWTVEMKSVALMGRTRDTRAPRQAVDWADNADASRPSTAAVTPGAPDDNRRLVVSGLVLWGELAVTD